MIAVTGHTSGFGLAIANRYNGPVLGFSRSTGHDILDYNARMRIKLMLLVSAASS